jgi:monoamine oxidase
MSEHDDAAGQGAGAGDTAPPEAMTRRRFLEKVGAVGGAAAVYETMVAMGLMRVPEAWAGPPQIPEGEGKGKSVVILGGGVAGLTAARTLLKAGCSVTVLEASSRLGGRNFTVSKSAGDGRNQIVEQRGDTLETQTCDFEGSSDTQYFEAGAGRLPYHHTAILSLCRELGVALEPYIMETRANRFQTNAAFGGAPIENRRIANDTRGHIADLLYKAIDCDALDHDLNPEDIKALKSLLVTFGNLNTKANNTYTGSSRSGYERDPGVTDPGKVVPPLPLKTLLGSAFWEHRFYQPEDYLWQTTLFHPVGGMRRIVDALAADVKRLGGVVQTGMEVTRIRNSAAGVSVDAQFQDSFREFRADYCISTIPLPLLGKCLERGFSREFVTAVNTVRFAPTCKIGWQAKERFWERLENADGTNGPQIFGGISWINHAITQMWYPSAGYFSPGPAVLTGAYNYARVAEEMGKQSLTERLRVGIDGGDRLHRGFRDQVYVGKGLSIAWQNVPFIGGGWAEWDDAKPGHRQAYARLLKPDGRFIVAGDQVSYLPGWQEGAVLSAYHVIETFVLAPPGAESQPILKSTPDTLPPAPDASSITGAG